MGEGEKKIRKICVFDKCCGLITHQETLYLYQLVQNIIQNTGIEFWNLEFCSISLSDDNGITDENLYRTGIKGICRNSSGC